MSRDKTNPRPVSWIVRFAIIASATTVTTGFALGNLQPKGTGQQLGVSETISSVEFMSFGEGTILKTIEEACKLTDCDETGLHPMIKSYADQMDKDQLDAARWAQVRLLIRGMGSLQTAMNGSDAAIAHLELTAAARIAKFYTSKINTLH